MGAQFNEALQNLGSTAIQLQTLQDLQNKLDYQNAVNSRLLAEQGMQATKDQQAVDKVNQDTALGSQIIPALGEYAILRGDSDGSGRYTTLSGVPGQAGSYGNVADYTGGFVPQQIAGGDSMTPGQRSAMDDMVNGKTKPLAFDKNGVGLPGAGDRIPNSAFTPLNDQTYGIAPDLANLKSEDLRKVGIAGLTPMQETAKLGLAGNNLPTAVNASKFLGTMQSGEDSSDAADQTQQNFDAKLALEKATLNQKTAASTGGDDTIQSDADQIKQGFVPPSVALQGRDPKHARAVRLALAKDGFNLSQANTAYGYWNAPKTQGSLQTINNFMPNVDQLLQLSDKVSRLGTKAGNQTVVSLQSQIGDVDANNFLSQLAISQDELMGALAGANNQTDQKLQQAKATIGPGMTVDQLKALAPVIENAVNARKVSIYRQAGPYGKFAAKDDPYLPDNYKTDIANNTYKSSISGGANNGGSPASSGGSGQSAVGTTIGKYKIVEVR